MPIKRYKAEQIVTLLRQIEVGIANGKTTPQACKEVEITMQTYYRWRKEYGGLKLDQAKRLKELERENAKLKRAGHMGLDHHAVFRSGRHASSARCYNLTVMQFPKFDPLVWANWEERFIREEAEAYRNAPAEEPTEVIPEHELMTAGEVCAKLDWSLRTLYRNTKARKLGYVKRDGRLKFRRVDVERYDKKRYVSEK